MASGSHNNNAANTKRHSQPLNFIQPLVLIIVAVAVAVAAALGVAAVVSNKLQQSVCKLPQRLGNQMAGKST